MTGENEALPSVQALADVATDKDKLFHDGYVIGIAEFIKTCATPMTIAIQGDWGTGKTSLIKLVEAQLRAEASTQNEGSHPGTYCKDIINTATIDVWQQSVANPRVDLFEILLCEMVPKLSGTDLATLEQVSGFVTAASQIVGSVFGSEEQPKEDSPFNFLLDSIFGAEEDPKPELENKFVTVANIEALQAELADTLRQTAEANGKRENSRFVVFIDGLDHIDPGAAVDLLEKIKTYLDCPRCVFVLALDEKTVVDGMRKKFGDKVDEKQRKMLFDKLVQAPLRIPISAYNLDKYVKDLLKGDEELAGELVEVFSTLLSEPTPLSIKRYINTMYLYQSVFCNQEEKDSSLAMLLAAVILELEGSRGFDTVASCAQGDQAQFAENLKAALGSLDLNDGINRAELPTLWQGEGGANEDAAKRDAFLSWVQRIK